MSEAPDTMGEAERLDTAFRAKAAAEIAAAEAPVRAAGAVRGQGDLLAEVLLVKGEPGPSERETHRALSGDDGSAIGKALDALGLPAARYALCSRPAKLARAARLERLRLMVEAIDPRTVVLLDATAAEDFAGAYGAEPLVPGAAVVIEGRIVLGVEDFEASLGDEARKRRAWRQLQSLAVDGR